MSQPLISTKIGLRAFFVLFCKLFPRNLIFCFVSRRNETVLYLFSNIVEQVIQSFASILAETSITFESSNERTIPDTRSFFKTWPITGNISNLRFKLFNVFILFCSKQHYFLAIYITETVIQLDFNNKHCPFESNSQRQCCLTF